MKGPGTERSRSATLKLKAMVKLSISFSIFLLFFLSILPKTPYQTAFALSCPSGYVEPEDTPLGDILDTEACIRPATPACNAWEREFSGVGLEFCILKPCAPSDIDRNGVVDVSDVLAVTTAVGSGSTDPRFDVNLDGNINQSDITKVSEECFGTSFTTPGSGFNPCQGGTCQTALGPISTDITQFAGKFLFIAIGLAGGIALILLVYGSVRVLTSSGNQQSLAAGRDVIIAAIAGLLFLIFSVLILRALGLIVGLEFG